MLETATRYALPLGFMALLTIAACSGEESDTDDATPADTGGTTDESLSSPDPAPDTSDGTTSPDLTPPDDGGTPDATPSDLATEDPAPDSERDTPDTPTTLDPSPDATITVDIRTDGSVGDTQADAPTTADLTGADATTPDAATEDAPSIPDLVPEPDLDDGLCPPEGPFGNTVGSIPPDATLTDCDGVEYSLHDLCELDASAVFFWAAWCPPCIEFADSGAAQAIADDFADDSFEFLFVITETPAFGAATQTQCNMVRDRYGLTMPVLYDPDDVFQSALGTASNDTSVVMDRGNVITFKEQYAWDALPARIESALEP